jgi:glycosyltransferase involved in cell wall biosynthesis
VSRPLRPPPDVAVCIASYNTRRATEVAIRRVLAQRDVNVSVHVGDAGSTDGSLVMLHRFADRGQVQLQIAPQGRTHGEWLDDWTASIDAPFGAFVDSDLFLLRARTLRRLLDAVVDNNAILATCRRVPEIPDYVSDLNNDRYRIATRVAPWLSAFRTKELRALGVSWQYRWEARPDLPEGAMSWDVGADVDAALGAAGRPAYVMPADFDREWIHVGGLSWRGQRNRPVHMRDRLKAAFVDAALLTTRLTSSGR